MITIFIDTIKIFQDRYKDFLRISIPYVICTSIADSYAERVVESNQYIYYFLSIASTLITLALTCSLIIYLSEIAYEKTIDPETCITEGLLHLPYMIIAYMISVFPFYLIYFLSQAIETSQLDTFFYLIFALGIYLSVKFSFSPYFIVLEAMSPIDSLKKSFLYTNGYFSDILLITLLFAAPVYTLSYIFQQFIGNVSSNSTLLIIGVDVFFGYLLVMYHIGFFKVFHKSYLFFTKKKALSTL